MSFDDTEDDNKTVYYHESFVRDKASALDSIHRHAYKGIRCHRRFHKFTSKASPVAKNTVAQEEATPSSIAASKDNVIPSNRIDGSIDLNGSLSGRNVPSVESAALKAIRGTHIDIGRLGADACAHDQLNHVSFSNYSVSSVIPSEGRLLDTTNFVRGNRVIEEAIRNLQTTNSIRSFLLNDYSTGALGNTNRGLTFRESLLDSLNIRELTNHHLLSNARLVHSELYEQNLLSTLTRNKILALSQLLQPAMNSSVEFLRPSTMLQNFGTTNERS